MFPDKVIIGGGHNGLIGAFYLARAGKKVLISETDSLIGGDIFHGHMTLNQLGTARPVIGADGYKGPLKDLYMCGSGTHPGGGVTSAPGHNTANAILRERRLLGRWFG